MRRYEFYFLNVLLSAQFSKARHVSIMIKLFLDRELTSSCFGLGLNETNIVSFSWYVECIDILLQSFYYTHQYLNSCAPSKVFYHLSYSIGLFYDAL